MSCPAAKLPAWLQATQAKPCGKRLCVAVGVCSVGVADTAQWQAAEEPFLAGLQGCKPGLQAGGETRVGGAFIAGLHDA